MNTPIKCTCNARPSFVYYSKLDSIGGDLFYMAGKTVDELKRICEITSNCVGFNTLGFFKKEIKELKPSQYFGESDGIYILRNKCTCFESDLSSSIKDKNVVFQIDYSESREIMKTRLPKLNYYTKSDLVGIAKRCDMFVFDNNIIILKPNPRIIFVSRFEWYRVFPFFMDTVFPHLKEKCILVFASEDFTFPRGLGDKRDNREVDYYKDYVDILLKSDYVKRIFVENLDTPHPKLIPIPLGITSDDNNNFYDSLINYKKISLDERSIDAFLCHYVRDGEQWDDRKNVTKYAEKWPFVKSYNNLSTSDFKDKLLNSKFCICVHGGGYDPSPRCFQALLCGCIPIIQHSPVDGAYSRYPVAFVDEWTPECLSKEKLDTWLSELRVYYEDEDKRKKVLDMLTLDYWWNIITSE